MEKNINLATLCMTRTTTPKSFRNFTKRRRYNLRSKQKFCFEICDLRDVFLRRLEPNIPQAPWTSSTEKHGGQLKIFCLGWKYEPEQNLPKKYAQSTRCKIFFTTEAAEVKPAGGNEKIARFDRSVRSLVTCVIPWTKGLARSPLLLAWLQRLDMLSVWPLSAKRA